MTRQNTKLILLSPKDNIFVLGATVEKGEKLNVDGYEAVMPRHLVLGHKIARTDIQAGQPILKYGAPIGVATEDIARGAHVHTHNIRSNYTKTHTLHEAQDEYGDTQ